MLQFQIPLIATLQSFYPSIFKPCFLFFSALGEEYFFFLLIPFIWMVIDRKMAARLALLIFASFYVNALFKELLAQPRPYQLSSSVIQMDPNGDGYGIPSGHAQSSLLVWLWLSSQFNHRNFSRLCYVLIGGIALSRVYLGVHFPTDIMGGWILALIGLWVDRKLNDSIIKLFNRLPTSVAGMISIVIPSILLTLFPTLTTSAAMGCFAGCGLGIVVGVRSFKMRFDESVNFKIFRFAVAFLLAMVVYLGLRMIFPHEDSPVYLAFRYIRYFLVFLTLSLFSSWLFRDREELRRRNPTPN